MASARYGYMHVTPSDLPSKKRPHSALSGSTSAPCALVPTSPSTTNAPRLENHPTDPSLPADVHVSPPIHDRSSTFTAYFSPTLPPYDLQALPALKSASHRILAWRIPIDAPLSSSSKRARQTTLSASLALSASGTKPGGPGNGAGTRNVTGVRALQTGSADDGETHGGRTVLRALEAAQGPGPGKATGVVGSCVVARWYGGVMLGPVRFRHMENAVVGAVEAWVVAERVERGREREEEERKGREREDMREREELVTELDARDGSIASLRGLLESKKGVLSGLEEGGDGHVEGLDKAKIASPVKKVEYGGLTLERLRVLDHARDRTVAFLLKQIDEVEEKIKAWRDMLEATSTGAAGQDESSKVKTAPVGLESAGAI